MMDMTEIQNISETMCACGKHHKNTIDEICVGKGVLCKLPQILKKYNAGKAFVLSDKNTYEAAGKKVCDILQEADISFVNFTLNSEMPEPDEYSVGSVIMHYDTECDIIIGVGSGVINDIGKILSNVCKKTYIIVGTAPSMDGYASASSSMTCDGLKISLPSTSANVIIGDTDILCNAPQKMLVSGVGDMLAKYVSICEWRISHLVTGEYYCENIAKLVRNALKRCVENVDGLLKRDEEAVSAVFEGLVIGGIAMAFAGISRPASGVEHYMSHVWDMRSAEFKIVADFHGIQCAIGTLIAIRLYEKLKHITPDVEKAKKYVAAFDYEEWSMQLRSFLGKGAESMIALEEKEQKYSVDKHKKRVEDIAAKWDEILAIINEELPAADELEKLMDSIGAPKTLEEIGLTSDILPMTFKATKDIRDKYVLSRLVWDLGIIDEITLVPESLL